MVCVVVILTLVVPPPFWHPAAAKGFILDWDGVLADTKMNFQKIRDKYFNGRFVPLLESGYLLEEKKREELERDLLEVEMEGAKRATPVEGAHELIDWLEENHVPWAVVSRNCSASVQEAALRCGIKLPKHVFTRDEKPIKPDPRVLWAAAERLGVPYKECVVVGDFLYDLQGARRAKMRAILVERKGEAWVHWADAEFESVNSLVEALRKPTPLVPWEYRKLVEQKGERWLRIAWQMALSLPVEAPKVFDVAYEAAKLGVGSLVVKENVQISLEQWASSRLLTLNWVEKPLLEGLNFFLKERFPQLNIRYGDDAVTLPSDPEDMEPFLEEKILRC